MVCYAETWYVMIWKDILYIYTIRIYIHTALKAKQKSLCSAGLWQLGPLHCWDLRHPSHGPCEAATSGYRKHSTPQCPSNKHNNPPTPTPPLKGAPWASGWAFWLLKEAA